MPRASTIARKNRFLEAYLNSNLSVVAACRDAGISKTGYYKWLHEDPAFKEAVDSQLEGLLDVCEGHLYQLARSGDLGTVKYVLEHKASERGWGQKPVDVAGAIRLEVVRKVMGGREDGAK